MIRGNHQSIVLAQSRLIISTLMFHHTLHLTTSHHHIINFQFLHQFAFSIRHQHSTVSMKASTTRIVIMGHIHWGCACPLGGSLQNSSVSVSSSSSICIRALINLLFGRFDANKDFVAHFFQCSKQCRSVILHSWILEVVAILVTMCVYQRWDIMSSPFLVVLFGRNCLESLSSEIRKCKNVS